MDKVISECENLDVELRIIGDGEELKNLKKLSSKPIFLGRLDNTSVLEEMKNADIFALPSVNETFGMVYLEAMACGCITVCTENDGVAGIIENGKNGFFWKDGIISEILNLNNKDEILANTYLTMQNIFPSLSAYEYLMARYYYYHNLLFQNLN